MAENDEDVEKKIADLKRRAEELSSGQMAVSEVEDCPPELEESFWEYVVRYEEAPWTTNFHQLEAAGVTIPPPDSLSDEELAAKLWEVIHSLSLLRVFIDQTNHLSDRELYTHLWTDALREETKSLTLGPDAACHLPLLGCCSDEDNWLYLKYYADENWRQQWHKDFPSDPIPEHEDPPYDRDQYLPKADHGLTVSEQAN